MKNKCEFKSNNDIPIQGEIVTPKFIINIRLRTPCVEKEFIVTTKEIMQITKAYPEFKLDNLTGEIIKNEIERLTSIKVKTYKRSENSYLRPSDQVNKKGSFGSAEQQQNEEKINLDEFTKDELEDPDNIENMNSLMVMEKKIKLMDEQIKKIEGRPPQKLRQRFLQIKCRYNTLKEQISENSLTVENYMNLIKKQIDKDKRLSMYFKQNDLREKLGIVSERMKIMISELDELIKQMKKAIS